jgi:aryl-alcohol dehydrogenase-like predicted oxidoreductase
MKKRRIGSLDVSVVGIGCNNFGWALAEEPSKRVIDAAIDAGVNFFDTADRYGAGQSEEFLGRALGKRRRDVLIATKFGGRGDGNHDAGGGDPAYVRRALQASLGRLGTDYVDLYQLHRPDPSVPIAETLGALDGAVKAGLVREIGTSNFDVAQLREARAAVAPGAVHFASVQNEYSLFHREPESGVLAECARQQIAFLPWFPLASGMLTGKFRRGQPAPPGTRVAGGGRLDFHFMFTDENLAIVEDLAGFAESRSHTLLELAVSWLLAHDVLASVIAGATTPEQIAANAHAADWNLGPEDLAEIDRLLGGRRVKTSALRD